MRFALALLLAAAAFGQTLLEPRIASETLPSGGLMQIKVELTSPHPITTTGTEYTLDSVFDSIEGVAIFSPAGDAYGVGVPQNGRMRVNIVSPQASLGTQLDYPYLVTAAHIRSGLAAGTVIPINFGPGLTFTGINGEVYTLAGKNGTLTIGGSVSVTNVVPGGGVVPAGTTVRLLGTGFTPQTRVDVNEASLGSQRFISATEIDFTLTSAVDLTGRRFRVRNPDNSEALYYSYLRPVAVGASSRALLNACHPLYPNGSAASAALNLPAPPANGFVAVALRNMGGSTSSVQLDLLSSGGAALGNASVSVPSGGQFLRTAQELFGSVPSGASVRVTASAAIQILGLRGDEATGAVTAFLPGGAPASTLTVSPASLTFDGSGTRTVSVGSTGASLAYTASTNAAWLTVTPSSGQSPATLNVTANAAGLAPGVYTGTVTISPGQSVAVTLNVPVPVALTVSPLSLAFDGPGSKTLSVTASGPAIAFTASTSASWLAVTPSTGQTPATLTVTVNTAGLSPGLYTGTVSVSPGQTIPVSLSVSAAPSLTVSPLSLVFDGTGSKSVFVSSTGTPVSFTASTSATWLSVTPSFGQTPATLTVTASAAGLAPGSYTGTVTVAPGQSVAVTLNVPVAPSLAVSPSSLLFDGSGTKTVNVASTGAPIAFTATANAAWLTVTPATGQTPAALSITANATGLAAGTHTGTVTVAPGQIITVTLTVANPIPSAPQLAAVVNAASQSAASLFAPGQIVTLYGGAMGPPAGVAGTVTGDRVDTQAGGVRVLFGATPAPILFASATQVNAIVPYEANGATAVQVEYQGRLSSPRDLFVSAVGPALFTQNASGRGAAAVLNQDYSLNLPVNPATRGSAIMIYATGGGQTAPASATGEVAGAQLKTTAVPVTVTVGGRRIDPLYAGIAPGLVTGLLQVNVLLPDDVPTGDAVPIAISIAGVSSQDGVTVAIR